MAETDATVEYTRQLIHVPIVHSSADMGTMGEKLAAAYIERFGRRHWEEHIVVLDNFWKEICTGLGQLTLDYHQVDLYQDGLPVCGRELDIVKETAAKGSENHQLLLDLIDRGATLMGTEDPGLLLEEYRNLQAALGGGAGEACSPVQATQPPRYEDTLRKRDAYIGRRIGQSLRPGRTGILFLGMMHNVESFLPADIVVRHFVPPVLGSRSGRG